MKVAIAGHGPMGSAAFKLKGFEVWGFNDIGHYSVTRYDRWFQLHTPDYLSRLWPPWEEQKGAWQIYCQMAKKPIPLYMHQHYEDIPNSVAFPKERIERELPRGWYHCGTFDWLVAFAILEGAEEIHIYGVGLSYNGEPLSARACLEYWLGVAEGKGIKTHVESSDLFYTFQLLRSRRQYAWDESRPILNLEDDGLEVPIPPLQVKLGPPFDPHLELLGGR